METFLKLILNILNNINFELIYKPALMNIEL